MQKTKRIAMHSTFFHHTSRCHPSFRWNPPAFHLQSVNRVPLSRRFLFMTRTDFRFRKEPARLQPSFTRGWVRVLSDRLIVNAKPASSRNFLTKSISTSRFAKTECVVSLAMMWRCGKMVCWCGADLIKQKLWCGGTC